jgi:hypothetical protein
MEHATNPAACRAFPRMRDEPVIDHAYGVS